MGIRTDPNRRDLLIAFTPACRAGFGLYSLVCLHRRITVIAHGPRYDFAGVSGSPRRIQSGDMDAGHREGCPMGMNHGAPGMVGREG